MVKKKKISVISLFAIFLVSTFLISTNCLCAVEFDGVDIISETKLPEDLNLKVNKDCTEHSFFKQATAWSDGSFAICTSGITTDGVTRNTNCKFIDIYNTDGEFVKELTFETTSDIAIERTEKTLNIYLYSGIICYNLESNEFSYYTTPDYQAYNSGYVENLRKDKFTVGEWTYSYEKNFDGYVKLIRSNGNDKQILYEIKDGSDMVPMGSIVFSVVLFGLGCCFMYKRKNKRHIKVIDKE